MTTTRTVTDVDGTWTEYLNTAGVTFARVLTAESAAYTTAEAARRQAIIDTIAADQARATTVNNVLANLDAGNRSLAQVQTILAALIRYVGQNVPRNG